MPDAYSADSEDAAYRSTAGRLKHVPTRPPRPCTPAEGAYLREWQEWVKDHPGNWLTIFSDCPTAPRQRAASVAASFVVMMGTTAGKSFTHCALAEADRGESTTDPSHAFLRAWAEENCRRRGINNGLRFVEYMLASEYPIQHDKLGGSRVNWRAVPDVTMDDMDVIEAMVCWWASDDARVLRMRADRGAHQTNEQALWALLKRNNLP